MSAIPTPFANLFSSFPDDGTPRALTESEQKQVRALERRIEDGFPTDTSVIPRGIYCYTIIEEPCEANGFKIVSKTCPYWTLLAGKPKQANGYCSYLGQGDWDEVKYDENGAITTISGTSLLWDGCKECGINIGDEE